jgi:hypothetical protein
MRRIVDNGRRGLIALAAVTLATVAEAGISDSALPVLQPGKKTLHLYSVAGAMQTLDALGTYIECTNVSDSSILIGAEFFGSGGGVPP